MKIPKGGWTRAARAPGAGHPFATIQKMERAEPADRVRYADMSVPACIEMMNIVKNELPKLEPHETEPVEVTQTTSDAIVDSRFQFTFDLPRDLFYRMMGCYDGIFKAHGMRYPHLVKKGSDEVFPQVGLLRENAGVIGFMVNHGSYVGIYVLGGTDAMRETSNAALERQKKENPRVTSHNMAPCWRAKVRVAILRELCEIVTAACDTARNMRELGVGVLTDEQLERIVSDTIKRLTFAYPRMYVDVTDEVEEQ